MQQTQPRALRAPAPLHHIVKSLSDLSQVNTAHLKRAVAKQARMKRLKRSPNLSQPDQRLCQPHIHLSPQPRLNTQGSPLKKQSSLEERSIQSRVHLTRADYQLKKLAIEKSKNRVGLSRYPSPKKRTRTTRSEPKKGPGPFDPYGSLNQVDLEKEQLNKIKRVVTTGRMRMNTLHQAHQNALKSLSLKKREILEQKGAKSPEFINLLMPSLIKSSRRHYLKSVTPRNKEEDESSGLDGLELLAESRIKAPNHQQAIVIEEEVQEMPIALPARSVVLRKPKKRKEDNKLQKLIKRSKRRSAIDCEDEGTKLTQKQRLEQQMSRNLLQHLRGSIQEQNRNKETIVFGHLKKILYGQRKGKYIKDTTFRTILKGECSTSYMNVVRQQEALLDSFTGNERSRRQLVQSFANILGQMRSRQFSSSRELPLDSTAEG